MQIKHMAKILRKIIMNVVSKVISPILLYLPTTLVDGMVVEAEPSYQ